MPTVLPLNGLRVVIYPNDHRPAHVHVMGAGREAVFNLNCPGGPPEPREVYGFNGKDARRIRNDLAAYVAYLCERWSEIHDTF